MDTGPKGQGPTPPLFGWSIIDLFFAFAVLLLDSRLGPLLVLGAAPQPAIT